MTFVAEELSTFSIRTFKLQNLLNFNNMRPWPLNFFRSPQVENRCSKDAESLVVCIEKIMESFGFWAFL